MGVLCLAVGRMMHPSPLMMLSCSARALCGFTLSAKDKTVPTATTATDECENWINGCILICWSFILASIVGCEGLLDVR